MPDPELAQDSDFLPVPPSHATPRSIVLAVLSAAAGFLVIATLLHLAFSNALSLHAEPRSEKLALLHTLTPPAYTAAFGSSHIHNGFDPRAFDRATAGSPLATRSLNLAVYGGSQAEQRVMALQFLHQLKPPPTPQPCLVLLELTAGANFTNDHLVHPRAINLYDLPTARFVADLTDPGMSRKQRFGRGAYAYVASALHYLSIGMLSSRIFVPAIDPVLLQAQTVDDRRGLQVEQPTPRNQAYIHKLLASAPAHPTLDHQALSPGNSELIEQLAQSSPVPNVSFAYIIFPKLSDLTQSPDFPDHLQAAGQQVPIINLARPERFPALYQPQLWFDDAHFDEAGSAAGTAVLAQQLELWYQAHGYPKSCGTNGGPR